MADEETKTTEETPKEELDNTTKDLIKEALSEAGDTSKPWYKRGLSYIIGIALIVAFYAGDKLGPEVVDTVVQVLQQLFQLL